MKNKSNILKKLASFLIIEGKKRKEKMENETNEIIRDIVLEKLIYKDVIEMKKRIVKYFEENSNSEGYDYRINKLLDENKKEWSEIENVYDTYYTFWEAEGTVNEELVGLSELTEENLELHNQIIKNHEDAKTLNETIKEHIPAFRKYWDFLYSFVKTIEEVEAENYNENTLNKQLNI